MYVLIDAGIISAQILSISPTFLTSIYVGISPPEKNIVNTIIFVIIGVSLIFKKKYDDKKKKINEDNEYLAIFSGQTINYSKEKLEKLALTALFGGIKCDLRNSLIKEDVYIDATAFFGGIDLLVPENVKVKVKPFAIFGGVETKKLKANDKEKPVIYINATCVFGGIDVKHE